MAFYLLYDRNIATSMQGDTGYPTNIRVYFGEKIALYVGDYSWWLLVPEVIGLVFQIVVFSKATFPPQFSTVFVDQNYLGDCCVGILKTGGKYQDLVFGV